MGGRPKVHATDEYELGVYSLNLSPAQLAEVAAKLAIPEGPEGSDFMEGLASGQDLPQPPDEQIIITFRGRYVRITYQEGVAVLITP
jgi:hypothetical protein